jgi:hypothetical protein
MAEEIKIKNENLNELGFENYLKKKMKNGYQR